jgi:hypothetical protein
MHTIRYTSASGAVALGVLQHGKLISYFPPEVELHLLHGSADELRAQIE